MPTINVCYGEYVMVSEPTGHFVTCPHCLEHYWSEDGHPEGTLCPVFGIDENEQPLVVEPTGRFIVCQHHGVRYWSEDVCPKCDKEFDQ